MSDRYKDGIGPGYETNKVDDPYERGLEVFLIREQGKFRNEFQMGLGVDINV